jgi:hypothetical protein
MKILEDGTENPSRNFGKLQQVLRNHPEERRLETLNSDPEPNPF